MSAAPYPIPAALHAAEQVIERSRFIATLAPAATVEEARAFIDTVRETHPQATHNCWAYVVGPPGSTAQVGMSDAGEPHGTAGRPMLDVLLHSGTGDIAAVVTRYYGGVKLGKGGLVRAYGGAVQHALASLPLARRVERSLLRITVGYADVEPLRRLLTELDAEVDDEAYGEFVRWRAAVPITCLDELRRGVADLTSGRGTVEESDE